MSGKMARELQELAKQEKRDKKKHEPKKLKLKSHITEHDLEIKIKHVLDWLQKDFQVKYV